MNAHVPTSEFGSDIRARVEEILITLPPGCFLMCSEAYLVHKNGPVRLIPTTLKAIRTNSEDHSEKYLFQ